MTCWLHPDKVARISGNMWPYFPERAGVINVFVKVKADLHWHPCRRTGLDTRTGNARRTSKLGTYQFSYTLIVNGVPSTATVTITVN